ncbi:MAG: FMN-binding protein [Lachnospiraceae bacterium]
MKENRLFPQKCRRALLALAAAGLLSFSGALAADYADGVYQDLAPGYNDDVIVSVTVKDGKITEFDAKNRNGNESEYFGKALDGIRQAVLEKQGLEGVDAVSGATGSSDSMLTAMKGILEQLRAGGGRGQRQQRKHAVCPALPHGRSRHGAGLFRAWQHGQFPQRPRKGRGGHAGLFLQHRHGERAL